MQQICRVPCLIIPRPLFSLSLALRAPASRRWSSAAAGGVGDTAVSLATAIRLAGAKKGAAAAMRTSCNGCRVLRKGCSDSCSIRPCLQWIKNPESQANATVFLAKFYGRAGLINLIDAGPEHLRPAIFRSLLYEACGRIVNPIFGSVGILWSGSWQLCHSAVEAVLKGAPIMQIPPETVAASSFPPFHRASSSDIRHVSKGDACVAAAVVRDLHKVNGATRTPFKRSGNHSNDSAHSAEVEPAKGKRQCQPTSFGGAPSHVSSDGEASEPCSPGGAVVPRHGDRRENETMLSLETAEACMPSSHGGAETVKADCPSPDDSEVELELTLGFEPVPHSSSSSSNHTRGHSPVWSSSRSPAAKSASCTRTGGFGGDMLTMDLGLDLPSSWC